MADPSRSCANVVWLACSPRPGCTRPGLLAVILGLLWLSRGLCAESLAACADQNSLQPRYVSNSSLEGYLVDTTLLESCSIQKLISPFARATVDANLKEVFESEGIPSSALTPESLSKVRPSAVRGLGECREGN